MNDYSGAPGQTTSSLPTVTQELIKRVVVEGPTPPPRTENQSDLGLVFFRPESRGWRGFQHLMR
jgi:hypothetical protein